MELQKSLFKRHSQCVQQILLLVSFIFMSSDHVSSQEIIKILVGPNVLVSRDRNGNFGEAQIAVDPTNSLNLLGTGMSDSVYWDGRRNYTKGYYSNDGGNSWKTVAYPKVPDQNAGDPQVAFGKTGTGYFLIIGEGSGGKNATLLYRSEDSGKTWKNPAELKLVDRPAIVSDYTTGRFKGNVYIRGMYVEKNHNQSENPDYHIGVFRSVDDGRSWIGPVDVANTHHQPDRGMNGTDIAIFSDGELFVPFLDWANTDELAEAVRKAGKPGYDYWFVTSKNGAVTFSSPQKLVIEGGGQISGGQMAFYAIDNSEGPNKDRIYVTWTDHGYSIGMRKKDQMAVSKLWVSYSSNRGKTWSTPKPITAGKPALGNQYLPAIAVNRDGVVALSWYDTSPNVAGEDSVLLNRYFTASIDGGVTFTNPVQVSSVSSYPDMPIANLIQAFTAKNTGLAVQGGIGLRHLGGDYLGLTSDSSGTFHAIWGDNRTGSNQLWTARIRVESASSTGTVGSTPRDLVEADVTDRVEAVADPLQEFPPTGTIEVPIRLKNKSDKPIYGPITVEVITGRLFERDATVLPIGTILNAMNGKSAVGAIFDYSRSFGNFNYLAPGAISEGIIWRFKAPLTRSALPNLKFKVIGRIERPK